MSETMTDYIEKYSEGIKIIAGDFLKCKHQTLEDYLDFIRVPCNQCNELLVHLLVCETNLKVVVVTKTGFLLTVMHCDVFSADFMPVYLGKSTFRDTIPIPSKPSHIPDNNDVNKHEAPYVIDPNRQFTRSMGDVKTTPTSTPPSPQTCP